MQSLPIEYRVPLIFKEQRRGVIITSGKTENLEILAKEIFNLTSPFQVVTKTDQLQVIFSNEVLRSDELEIKLIEIEEDKEVEQSIAPANKETCKTQIDVSSLINKKNSRTKYS